MRLSVIMAVIDGHGLPIAVHMATRFTVEPHFVPATLAALFFANLPMRSIGDSRLRQRALDDFIGKACPSRRRGRQKQAE